MCDWQQIRSNADIDFLLSEYNGFHDSCLVRLHYQSGSYVNKKNAMAYGTPENHEVRMLFHSQCCKYTLELSFTGVRKCSFAGFQENYFCEIFDCHLAFHTDLIKHRDMPLIVWADWAGFSPKTFVEDELLHEPHPTYVVAENLKWRFIKYDTDM